MERNNIESQINPKYLADYIFTEYDELDYIEDLIKIEKEIAATDKDTKNIENTKAQKQPKEPQKITINLDPDFDIFEDFQLYNMLFFENKLGCIRLEWSKRMTLCAGIFSVKAGDAVIRLSEPLLKFRNVAEVKETLIHEMIHSWVYVLNLDMSDDASGHGKNFQLKMFEINKQTGLNITVYHSFHDEVDYYRKHIWRCDGCCQHEHPYYGYVRRAMNRPPGKSDPWWDRHQEKCGGTFVKIAGDENKKEKKEKVKIDVNKKLTKGNSKLDKYITIVKKDK
jgi:predicted SprT family Zn-dependent metalloprotease